MRWLQLIRKGGQVLTTEIHAWRDEAACLGADPELFFPITVTGPMHEATLTAARGICQSCEVISACLNFALAEGIDDGIWAGTTPDERRRMPATRRSMLLERYREEMSVNS